MMNKILVVLTFIMAAYIPTPLYAEGWTNPMTLPGLGNRSLGDPYIMKYRGYYYLYVSAGDRNIYCWRSKDLMEWSNAYICCTDETTAVAYAPEVIYWNGLFYMCTSPRGGGHYMLTSDSPMGPFVHQTENLGRDIDGSMFVDDNGKWYFYHANNGGIRGCQMPTHLTYGNDEDLGCRMSGQWTEGPCVFKRNGLYYLIYTGNHVWTVGYRIDYAMSSSGPLSGFQPQSEQNPILIDTETPAHRALGHGTAFIGPDLDTYFFCYHNLQDNKSRRLLNFERIGWNGDKLMMTGPTDWEQDRPLVAANDYFERTEIGEKWTISEDGQWKIVNKDYLNQNSAEGGHMAIYNPCSYENYTAEFTMKAVGSSEGCFGAIFSYQDAENYSEAVINVAERKLEVNIYVDGVAETSRSYSLPGDFDPASWHVIRVEKNARRTRIYIDGMRKYQQQGTSISGGRAGYITRSCKADFSYFAISPYVDGNGILDVSLPIPGIVPANLCVDVSGNAKAVAYSLGVGSSNSMRCNSGSSIKYRVNVRQNDTYNIGVRYRSTSVVHIRLLMDDKVLADEVELSSSRTTTTTHTLQDLSLSGGQHLLTVEVLDGSPAFYEFIVKRGVQNPHIMADNFDSGFSDEWGYQEGNWTIVDGQLESTGGYGKMLMGGFDDIHLTDYTVECDINYFSGATNGGLLFRTTNASTGGADDNPVLGTDFLQGYVFLASASSATLGKHNYGWQALMSVNHNINLSVPHHMKVEVEGSTFRCFLDDMEKPLITYTDTQPFITGRAGFRAHDSRIRFDNFIVTPKEQIQTSIQTPWHEEDVRASGRCIFNLQGQHVSSLETSPRGIYIVREDGKSRKVTNKR